MSKNWKIAEKITGLILISWGIFSLIISIWNIYLMYDFWFVRLENSWNKLSLYKITKNHLVNLILHILTLFAGFKLLSNKKTGWILGVVILLYQTINFILLMFTFDIKEDINGETINETLFFSLSSLLPLIFFTLFLFLFLISKQIRTYYKPTKSNWIIIFCLLTVLLVNKII